jgi:hypothetical protein
MRLFVREMGEFKIDYMALRDKTAGIGRLEDDIQS